MSTGRFDDGNREVPGGIAEPVRRVLVVGAGIAGSPWPTRSTTPGWSVWPPPQ